MLKVCESQVLWYTRAMNVSSFDTKFPCSVVNAMKHGKHGTFDELRCAPINFQRVEQCIKLFLYEFNSLAEVTENT